VQHGGGFPGGGRGGMPGGHLAGSSRGRGPGGGGGAIGSRSPGASFAHGNRSGGPNFAQRNFGGGPSRGQLAHGSGGFGGRGLSGGAIHQGPRGGHNNSFVNRHFAGGQGWQHNGGGARGVSRPASLAGVGGRGGSHGTGHLHQQWFGNSGHSHAVRQANFNHSGNWGRQGWNSWGGSRHNNFHAGNFNNRWSGGWNRWGRNSFFFGFGTPFGGFYRGFYPYGYGFWPGFSFGFFPYFSYGFGYGYPYYYGWPGYSYASYLYCQPYYNYGNYGYAGYGYPYAAYGYDYPYSYGYPAYTTYSYASANPAYVAADGVVSDAAPLAVESAPALVDPPALDSAPPGPADAAGADDLETSAGPPKSVDDITAADFAGQGEIDFKAGKYDAAARNFRHALVDDPSNAGVLMLLGQALFAIGQFDEAAGATAMAMQALPQHKWGAVVENYKQLYGKTSDYTAQLRSLEKARDDKPDSPALRFLLGFHYAHLGYPSQATRELNKAIELEPRDQMAKKLRDAMAAKKEKAQTPAAEPTAKRPPGAVDS